MKRKSLWTTTLFYVLSFVVLVVLIEATWGLTAGVLTGARMGTKATQTEISRILKEHGIKEPDPSKSADAEWYDNLPLDVKMEIRNAVKKNLSVINWFAVTLAVSAFAFAVAGFLCGFINRAFIPIGLLVILSFLVNNPVVRFPHAKVLDSQQKVFIVVSQFAISYLLGYLGASIGRRREKNET